MRNGWVRRIVWKDPYIGESLWEAFFPMEDWRWRYDPRRGILR
jgi:hypothetical protein